MKSLTFHNINNRYVKISENAVSKMQQYSQKEPGSAEAGGILIGRFLIDCHDVVVDDVTLPSPLDHRSRKRFKRDPASHQAMLDSIWELSNGRYNYLGEWHTHPENNPQPSPVDIKSWQSILQSLDDDKISLFFVIVGLADINVWQGCPNPNRIYQLSFASSKKYQEESKHI